MDLRLWSRIDRALSGPNAEPESTIEMRYFDAVQRLEDEGEGAKRGRKNTDVIEGDRNAKGD